MSSEHMHQLSLDRSRPGIWTITLHNPPINLLGQEMIDELQILVAQLETDQSVKVALFESADPDFFISHYDTRSAGKYSNKPGPTGYSSWLDFVLRLSNAPVVSIAKIRGRTRGVGNEFILACDLRFASKKRAIFGQPEVGVGVVPGGGALEWLPRLVGRSRALEIVLSANDFDADTAERYGMVNRAIADADLDQFVEAFASRIASFDKRALGAAKKLIGRIGIPDGRDMEASNRVFFEALAWPRRTDTAQQDE